MLTEWPINDIAFATTDIWDITENKCIPKGAKVEIQDHDHCADLWIVEYDGKIYLATLEELA